MLDINNKYLNLLIALNSCYQNLRALRHLNTTALIFGLLFLSHNAFAQLKLSIKGVIGFEQEIKKIEFGIIEAKKTEQLLKVIPIVNKDFQIDIDVNGLETYFLRYGDRMSIFDLGPGIANILVKDSLLRNIVIKDNLAHDEQNLYNNQLLADTNFTNARRARANRDDYQLSGKADPVILAKKNKRYEDLELLSKQTDINHFLNWLNNNPNSYINSKKIFGMIGNMPDSVVKAIFKNLPNLLKNNSWAKLTQYWINGLAIGSAFPKNSFYDTRDKLTKLDTKTGYNYTLVDFWASWCIPCRKENPLLLSVYKKYKKQGLEIIGISVDDDIQAWLNAVKEDQLDWKQLRGNPETYYKYLLKAIPSNFLLDQNGKVIAKNLSAIELEKFLDRGLSAQ
jgi:thiol-disulfide isomerase/thioredoxin